MSPKRRSQRERPPTFFVDENISPALSSALRNAGANSENFFDHFERGTPDQVWLLEVGEREWFVLTRDARQRSREAELDAIKRARVGQFVLRGESIAGETIIRLYVDALPRMLKRVASTRPPFIYHLNKQGALTVKLSGKHIPAKHRRWKT